MSKGLEAGECPELWNVTHRPEVLDIATLEVSRWEVCPGASQEAVTMDGEGRLWIGYDLGGI